jgi:NADH dehydrogenase [ubiquinone] 1 alpha subcomplex assembly factor 5
MSDSMQVFDRKLVQQRRNRAATTLAEADFLLREGAERLADRLLDIARTFPLALDLGCHTGQMGTMLKGHPKIGALFQAEFSPGMAVAARKSNGRATICADEEMLPVAAGGLDLVTSNLSLHWVNDLPGAFAQIRQALKPDGLFLASLFGGDTLRELRVALMEADGETAAGVAPRVSPFTDVRDAGNLLTRAGFALPVVDADNVVVTYEELFKLMGDLRAMGETNTVLERPKTPARRDTFLRAADIYAKRFADKRGRLMATFQVITLTAWAPHVSQQKPSRPGSATARLADALKTSEVALDAPTPFPKK